MNPFAKIPLKNARHKLTTPTISYLHKLIINMMKLKKTIVFFMNCILLVEKKDEDGCNDVHLHVDRQIPVPTEALQIIALITTSPLYFIIYLKDIVFPCLTHSGSKRFCE